MQNGGFPYTLDSETCRMIDLALKKHTSEMSDTHRKRAAGIVEKVLLRGSIESGHELDVIINLLSRSAAGKTKEKDDDRKKRVKEKEIQNADNGDKQIFRIIEELRLFRRNLKKEHTIHKTR